MLLEIFVKTAKKKVFNNRLYKNIKTFRKQPFGNFSAFHSSTIPHFTSTIRRGLNLRRNPTSLRAHVLFPVYYVCYDCSTSVINALINFARCFTEKMRKKYAESTDQSCKFEASLSQKLGRIWPCE